MTDAATAETPFRLGVQTHFEQGWALTWLPRLTEVGASLVRDELDWAQIETEPGEYDFASSDLYMRPLAEIGVEVMIVQTGGNALHDKGATPHSPEGRAAQAAFLAAAQAHYGNQVTRIEIGNEVNAGESTSGPFNEDPARGLAELAAAARSSGETGEVLCAGTNTIALGFLRDFFLAGGLEACDAVSVHPYGTPPEALDVELNRLRALMQEIGAEKPIHVTEFGQWTDMPEEQPAHLVKMVAVLAASGVGDAIWYALADEPWWPNMGLFTVDGLIKPAGTSFAFVQKHLIPLGRPKDISPDRGARIFSYGPDQKAVVAWGAGQAVTVTGEAKAYDALGRPEALPSVLGDDPVILLGRNIGLTLAGPPVTDTLFGFGLSPWSYHARRPEKGVTPLAWRDWEWTSFFGASDLSPLSINANWITTARFGGEPFGAIERFTAPEKGLYRITAWWRSANPQEAHRVDIWRDGELLASGNTGEDGFTLPPVDVALTKGQSLDFEVSPTGPNGDGAAKRRIRIEGPLP